MSRWHGRKVFVTGADGFIGSHLSEALVRAGADVTALVLYNSFDSFGWLDSTESEIKTSMKMVRGDIRDAHQMIQLTKGQEIVFHLASLIAIPYSYEAPTSYVQTNIQGTTNVLLAARQSECRRIIHTSTSEVYGTALFTPITEEHPLQGQSPYSASKIGADMLAQSFFRSFDLPVLILRPFNTYGPRQSERAVIPNVIRQLLDADCETLKLGDMSPSRDFNFVSDTVSAFLKCALLDDANLGREFNVGSGRMVTIGEVVDILQRTTNIKKLVVQDEDLMRPPESEVMALMADAGRLTKTSGWQSQVTLEDGLAKTVEWWRDYLPNMLRASGSNV